jgi:uncharacterized ferritin-like protein (DUF455 family)
MSSIPSAHARTSLTLPNVWDKLQFITASCDFALSLKSGNGAGGVADEGTAPLIPQSPARDIPVLDSKFHPPKSGFSKLEGQARVLHDLASIELQAMELALRSLLEYPDAPPQFREELKALTISEGQHLRLCLEGLGDLGFKWGDWPVHIALWDAVSAEDGLLDRILIVHRFLEGSGLDAGSILVRRLEGVDDGRHTDKIVRQINFEEIGHVKFGSDWYRRICALEKIDPTEDYPRRMDALRVKLPKRMEKLNHDLRAKAGFTPAEIDYCERLRESFLPPTSRPKN